MIDHVQVQLDPRPEVRELLFEGQLEQEQAIVTPQEELQAGHGSAITMIRSPVHSGA
jgi:hypothetical protein